MKHKMLIALLIAGLILGACSPTEAPVVEEPVVEAQPAEEQAPAEDAAEEAPPEPEPMSFTDDLERTITLESYASAIVSLAPSAFESLFAIGAGEQIVGREDFSLYPEEGLDIPSVGSLWGELPAEAILALEPDLVIAPQIISPEQVTALEELGLTVYWMANPSDFEGLYANLRVLAEMTGYQEEAEELISALSARVAAVEEVIANIEETPTVFYELDAADPENPYTVGEGVFIDKLITMAGGANIGAVLQGDYAQMSSEEIIAQNPQVILLADAPYGVTPESVAERSGWEAIDAVVNDMVLPFDPFIVSVPGPRMVDGLESMAQLLHPGLFE